VRRVSESLRNGVHIANAVVWEPVSRRQRFPPPPPSSSRSRDQIAPRDRPCSHAIRAISHPAFLSRRSRASSRASQLEPARRTLASSRAHRSPTRGGGRGGVPTFVGGVPTFVGGVPTFVRLLAKIVDSGPFYTSERRGGVQRRRLKLKGAEGGY
jgi:hypothetical protein